MHVLTPKRFEGLEEDKIAGYSNIVIGCQKGLAGLEEDKIAGYSNIRQLANQTGLEGCEIAGCSNAERSAP